MFSISSRSALPSYALLLVLGGAGGVYAIVRLQMGHCVGGCVELVED